MIHILDLNECEAQHSILVGMQTLSELSGCGIVPMWATVTIDDTGAEIRWDDADGPEESGSDE